MYKDSAEDQVLHPPGSGYECVYDRAAPPNERAIRFYKDVDSRPWYKRWFTLTLDRLMAGMRDPIHYWPREDLRAFLHATGFRAYSHTMRDVLPYPHMLYVCWKPKAD